MLHISLCITCCRPFLDRSIPPVRRATGDWQVTQQQPTRERTTALSKIFDFLMFHTHKPHPSHHPRIPFCEKRPRTAGRLVHQIAQCVYVCIHVKTFSWALRWCSPFLLCTSSERQAGLARYFAVALLAVSPLPLMVIIPRTPWSCR
ncbi:hypothetical protein FA15DRAFT_277393 [Coprinopsis marcescibilis]|uniref:Uncharacterized protein n=1 Tax=Coprinopsis marcescibilis TaxID=230819 RepID=A0A5C3L146_COPMA|nr:hypothetical protein FA15DRAFT_277393 [Coprinopsis marcescibilis]